MPGLLITYEGTTIGYIISMLLSFLDGIYPGQNRMIEECVVSITDA